jgi:hypothetical protein
MHMGLSIRRNSEMLVAISGKLVDMTEDEKKIYDQLKRDFGGASFNGTIATNDDNEITLVNPYGDGSNNVSYAVMWFLINLMISQKLRKVDNMIDFMERVNGRVDELEERISKCMSQNEQKE